MAKLDFLHVLMRDEPTEFVFEVRRLESERLQMTLAAAEAEAPPAFFRFDTVDGKSIILNMRRLQSVRLRSVVSNAPSDLQRSTGEMQIKLIGREPVVVDYSDRPAGTFDLVTDLENGFSGWPSFHSDDGGSLFFQATEVEWIIAPKHVLAGGRAVEGDEESE